MTTEYAAAKAAIGVHAAAAGNALTPAMPSLVAFPVPKSRCLRVYYGGETEPLKMGGILTLNSEMVGKVTMIAAFWPVTTLGEDVAAAIDSEMEQLSHELRTRLNGDSQLGGTTTDLTLEYGEPDIALVGTTRFAIMVWRVVTDHVEYPRAA